MPSKAEELADVESIVDVLRESVAFSSPFFVADQPAYSVSGLVVTGAFNITFEDGRVYRVKVYPMKEAIDV